MVTDFVRVLLGTPAARYKHAIGTRGNMLVSNIFSYEAKIGWLQLA